MKKLHALFIGLCFMLYGSLSYAQSRCADGCEMYNVYFDIDVAYDYYTFILPQIVKENARISRSVIIYKEMNFIMDNKIQGWEGDNSDIDFVPDSLLVNLDDGNGWQLIGVGSTLSTVYPSAGEKNIAIRFIDHGLAVLYDKTIYKKITVLDVPNVSYYAPDSIWNLETPIFTPPCPNAYPVGHKYQVSAKGYANAYIKYANPDHILRNPVIIVDGFDPNPNAYIDPNLGEVIRYGTLGWDAIVQGLIETKNEQIIALIPNQMDTILQAGYDFIFLDFKDGTDYVQRNALLLQELIRKVNATKDCGGDETVIIGFSMGGQIARFALTQMEQAGEYHGVRTYVSFDSPHQGANVPLGLQAALWGVSHLPNANDLDTSAIAIWDGLDAPGARQMLYETFLAAVKNERLNLVIKKVNYTNSDWGDYELDDFQDASLDFQCLRDQFVAERAALGYPKYARNVAIINGNKNALNQGFVPGDWLLKVKSSSIIGDQAFNIDLKVEPTNPMLRIKMPESYFLLAPTLPSWFRRMLVYSSTPVKAYSSAPGSMQTFTGAFAKEMRKMPKLEVVEEQRTHCFMPSISTLDVNISDLNVNIENLQPLLNGLTPFEDFYAPNDNQFHVEITHGNLTWLNDELPKSSNLLNGLTVSGGTSFNFGGSYRYLNNFTVGSGGTVSINEHDEPTGFSTSGNPYPTGEFIAHTGKCGVIVENGGILEVGSVHWNNRATLRVVSGSTLHIKSGGIVRIKGYSQLIIEEGATLIIEEGGMINYWGDSTDNAPTLHIAGTLVVKHTGGDEAKLIGAGRMRVTPSAVIDIQDFATLTLEGTDKTKTILALDDNVALNVNDHNKLLLSAGKVTYGPAARIRANYGASLIANQVILQGNSNNSSTGIESDAATLVKLNHVDIHNMSIGLFLFNGLTNNTLFFIDNCNFVDCAHGIEVRDQNVLKSINNSFSGNTDVAISANHVEYLHIAHNTINAHNYGVLLYDVPVCKIMDTQIDNCDYGIFAQHKSNVFLSDQTIMSRNQTAIHLVGDADDGMVSMNCATLDSNVVGISGTDVLLDIDAEIHAFDSTQISPNIFKNILPNGLLFDICYEQRNISTIYAKSNYWDGMTTLPHYLYYHLYYTPGGGSCPSNTSNVTLDLSNAYTTEPSGCNFGNPGGVPSNPYTTAQHLAAPIQRLSNQCAISFNSHNYDVARQYKLGDERFKTDDFVEADLKYAPVSALNGNTRDNASDACRHYIDVAEVMVKVEEILKSHRSSQHTTRSIDALWSLWDTSAIVPRATRSSAQYCDLSTYPNPAADLLTLTIKGDHLSGQGTVTMYNAFGQVVKTYTLNGTHSEIPLYELSPGLYRLTYFSAVDNAIGETNVVVH